VSFSLSKLRAAKRWRRRFIRRVSPARSKFYASFPADICSNTAMKPEQSASCAVATPMPFYARSPARREAMLAQLLGRIAA
jgi:hypothetical protein